RRLQEQQEERDMEAQLMAEANIQHPDPSEHAQESSPDDDHISLGEALFARAGEQPPPTKDDDEFQQEIIDNYPRDKLFVMILEKPEDYSTFTIVDKVI